MTTTLRISVFCTDNVGLISAITGRLFDLGANLGDTTFSVLGTGAEFTAVCDVPDTVSAAEIKEQLQSISFLQEAEITVTPFMLSSIQGPKANITHHISVKGGDNPGLVARLTEVFVEFKANIVRLNSSKMLGQQGDQYLINFAVWIPESSAVSCLATIANTASALQMTCHSESVSSALKRQKEPL